MEQMLWYQAPDSYTYLFDVQLTVSNSGPDEAEGYVKFVFVDESESDVATPYKVLDTQYEKLKVEGKTTTDITNSLRFVSPVIVWEGFTKVYAEIVIDKVPDVTCNGSGRVPLNNWLLVCAFQGRLLKLGAEGVQYLPNMANMAPN